jgi:hypothetical protein
MAIGSGVGSQFGMSIESVYGTYVAPTRFLEATKASAKKVKNTADWDGLAAGRLLDRSDGRVVTTKAATVSVSDLKVTNRDIGLLLRLITGTSTAGAADAGTPVARTYTMPLVDTAGQFATFQSGVPLVGGTVKPQSALGCKVTSVEFECGVDELLTANIDLDAKDITESQTLAAASYATGRRPFHFGQMAVKVGSTVAGAASITGVRKVSLKVDRGLKVDQFYAGGAGLKSEPTTNAKVAITGTISADYITAADLADRFTADTQFALVWEFIGPAINAVPTLETLRFAMGACFLDGDTPAVDGPDVVTTDFPFKAYYDMTTTDPFTITYISQDTAL